MDRQDSLSTAATRWILPIILLFSLSTKLFLAHTVPYLNDWDERYHALVARNMAADNQFLAPKLYRNPVLPYTVADWSANHIWLHKQPVTLWLIALSIKVFGPTALAVRLPSIFLSTLAVYLTFLLGRRVWNDRTGLIAAGLFAIHGLTTRLATGRVPTDHVDVFFMFFILAAVAVVYSDRLASRRLLRNMLVGALLGLAILCKWLPAYTVVLVFLLRQVTEGRDMKEVIADTLAIVVVSVAIFLPWQVYSYLTYPEAFLAEQSDHLAHVVESLGAHANGPLYFLLKMPHVYGELFYVGLAYGMWAWLRKKHSEYLPFLVWIVVPLLFFSLVRTKMQGYTYFTAPAVFLLSAAVILGLFAYLRVRFSRVVAYIAVAALLISPGIRFFESWQFGDLQENLAYTFPKYYREVGERTVILNSRHPINDMFFTPAAASYGFTPARVTLDSLRREGYTLLLVE